MKSVNNSDGAYNAGTSIGLQEGGNAPPSGTDTRQLVVKANSYDPGPFSLHADQATAELVAVRGLDVRAAATAVSDFPTNTADASSSASSVTTAPFRTRLSEPTEAKTRADLTLLGTRLEVDLLAAAAATTDADTRAALLEAARRAPLLPTTVLDEPYSEVEGLQNRLRSTSTTAKQTITLSSSRYLGGLIQLRDFTSSATATLPLGAPIEKASYAHTNTYTPTILGIPVVDQEKFCFDPTRCVTFIPFTKLKVAPGGAEAELRQVEADLDELDELLRFTIRVTDAGVGTDIFSDANSSSFEFQASVAKPVQTNAQDRENGLDVTIDSARVNVEVPTSTMYTGRIKITTIVPVDSDGGGEFRYQVDCDNGHREVVVTPNVLPGQTDVSYTGQIGTFPAFPVECTITPVANGSWAGKVPDPKRADVPGSVTFRAASREVVLPPPPPPPPPPPVEQGRITIDTFIPPKSDAGGPLVYVVECRNGYRERVEARGVRGERTSVTTGLIKQGTRCTITPVSNGNWGGETPPAQDSLVPGRLIFRGPAYLPPTGGDDVYDPRDLGVGIAAAEEEEQRIATTFSEPAPAVTATSSWSDSCPTPQDREPVLVIPRLRKCWRVGHDGIGYDALGRGPQRYPGSVDPGRQGVAAIAAHRTTHDSPFYYLDRLREGDKIRLRTMRGTFTYEAVRMNVVKPDVDNALKAQGMGHRLVLTTCSGGLARRLVVKAVLLR